MGENSSSYNFLSLFDLIIEESIDDYSRKNLNIFLLKMNANEFDYKKLAWELIEPMINFTLSKSTIKELKSKNGGKLSKVARGKFREINQNKGELGELLLYCFLESHLKAPKILSKYELKTSNNDYVKGSDGVHLLKLDGNQYQLIFCESKTYQNYISALNDAFKSIHMFKNEVNDSGGYKSGMAFEKTLISTQLSKESFNEEEKEILKKIIYPQKNNEYEIDDAFGIFIGYEVDIDPNDKMKPKELFREDLEKNIKEYITSYFDKIMELIKKYELEGHSIYIYIMPFTEINKNRKFILEEVLS